MRLLPFIAAVPLLLSAQDPRDLVRRSMALDRDNLARFAKGSGLMAERTRVNDAVWLPKHITLHATARILLVKSLRRDVDITYSNYRRFQTDSRIVSTGQ